MKSIHQTPYLGKSLTPVKPTGHKSFQQLKGFNEENRAFGHLREERTRFFVISRPAPLYQLPGILQFKDREVRIKDHCLLQMRGILGMEPEIVM